MIKRIVAFSITLLLIAGILPAYADSNEISPIFSMNLEQFDIDEDSPSKGITDSCGGNIAVTVNTEHGGSYENRYGEEIPYVELISGTDFVKFEGIFSDYEETPDSGAVEIWLNASSEINNTYDVFWSFDSTSLLRKLLVDTAGDQRLTLGISNKRISPFLSGDTYYSNKWSQIVGTWSFDEGTCKLYSALYVNGVLAGENTQALSSHTDMRNLPLCLGFEKAVNTTVSAKEKVAAFNVYDVLLDSSQIYNSYNEKIDYYKEANITVTSHRPGEVAANPVRLSGKALMGEGQSLEISTDDGKSWEQISVEGGQWEYAVTKELLGEITVLLRITEGNSVIETVERSMIFAPPIELEAVNGEVGNPSGLTVKVKNIHKGDELNVTGKVFAALYKDDIIADIREADITDMGNGQSVTLPQFSFSGDGSGGYIKYWAADISNNYALLSPVMIFPQDAEEFNAVPNNVPIPEEGATASINVNPSTIQAHIDIASAQAEEYVTLIIYEPSGGMDYINIGRTDENGRIAFEYILKTKAEGKDYTAKVYSGGIMTEQFFRYYSQELIDRTLDKLKETSAEDVESDIFDSEPEKYIINVDRSVYNTLTDNRKLLALSAIAKKEFAAPSDVKEAFNAGVDEQYVLQRISQSKAASDGENNAKDILAIYADKPGVDLSSDYSKLDKRLNAFFNNWICGKGYDNYTLFKNAFEEGVLVELINQYQKFDIVKENVIENYGTAIGISTDNINYYKNLSYEKKVDFIEKWKKSYFTSRAEAADAFLAAVEEMSKPSSKPTGSKTGGGGGSIKVVPTEEAAALKPIVPEETGNASGGFTDVTEKHWAYNSIMSLSGSGILSGVGNNMFEPERPVVREEFLKILLTAFKLKTQKGDMDFLDVDADGWYYDYVASAYAAGICVGYDGKFGIGEEITRADMCVMIQRALSAASKQLTPSGGGTAFLDKNEIPDYAAEAVDMLNKAGIVQGVEAGIFAPGAAVSRAMAAEVIARLTENIF